MAKGKKRGPKTAWQDRAAYNRAHCPERLKPRQVENISAADAFAALRGTALNGWLTIKFTCGDTTLQSFGAGQKRLAGWFYRNGGELIWIYVWEAVGGKHVHALLHIPNRAWHYCESAISQAFDGHDFLLKRRTRGPDAMAYLCKGTDWCTHKRLARGSKIGPKRQGVISWKRSGTSESIGQKARQLAGFEVGI